jgi:uncharacterized protein
MPTEVMPQDSLLKDVMPKDLAAWVLTDGKAGDEGQCLAVAEAMGLSPSVRRVAPRPPWSWAMPWGPIDPADAPGHVGSPIRPPYPDLVIASGRRAVPYLRHVKRASYGRTFTVMLKDPRTGADAADLIWVAEHDRLRADNVIVTLTSPHRLSAARLAAARQSPPPALARLAAPRAAVLVGGDSRHHRFTAADMTRLVQQLTALARSGVALMATTSRRTPPALHAALHDLVEGCGGYLWDGKGDNPGGNPYIALLALADTVVVTADSTNMVGEATATGKPVLVFEPSGGHRKIAALIEDLKAKGIVRAFNGRLEGNAYQPLDATPVIAAAVTQAFLQQREPQDQNPGATGPRR